MTKRNKEIMEIVEDYLNRKSNSAEISIKIAKDGVTTVEATANLMVQYNEDEKDVLESSESVIDTDVFNEESRGDSFIADQDETTIEEIVEEVAKEDSENTKEKEDVPKVPDFKKAAENFVNNQPKKKDSIPSLSELVNRFD